MNDPHAVDESHPGFYNLNPEQQVRFVDHLKAGRGGRDLTGQEQRDMDKLKELVVHGVPLDENHPGFVGLDPYQKE